MSGRSPSPTRARVRAVLIAVSLLLLVVTPLWWAAAGAHRGWSKNRVAIQKTDEFTGIAFTEYEERFVPGVDVVLIGAAAAAGLAGLSLFFRNPKT